MTGSETSTVIQAWVATFCDLTAVGRFEVPWHQRRYDWTSENVDDLMADLDEAIAARRHCYFLGTIILVEASPRRPALLTDSGLEPSGSGTAPAGKHQSDCWQINDGQQRLVTLSLICARLLRTLDGGDPERARLARRVLFDVDKVCADDAATSARPNGLTPRLTPPLEDRARYRLLLQGQNVHANGRLTAAWERIDHFVARLARSQSQRFFDFLIRNVEFACLSIPRIVDPNAVFETINCRGKPLEDLDLLRNHLYSYFNDDAEPTRRAAVHARLERTRAQLRDDSRFTDYARCYFQFRYGFLRRSAFYRETRRCIVADSRGRAGALANWVDDLVTDLARPERVELFRIIASPTRGNSFVDAFAVDSGHGDDPRNLSTLLRELRDYTVTQPLVFALLLRYVSTTDAERRRRAAEAIQCRLANLTSFVMRTAFVSPKFEPSQVERELSDAARLLAATERIEAVDIHECLKRCDAQGVLDDATFTTRMETIEMRDARKIKRLLLGIDPAVRADDPAASAGRFIVEHILPKVPRYWRGGWSGFERSAPEMWVHRLGNLALLHREDRKPIDVEQHDFAAKRRASSFTG